MSKKQLYTIEITHEETKSQLYRTFTTTEDGELFDGFEEWVMEMIEAVSNDDEPPF